MERSYRLRRAAKLLGISADELLEVGADGDIELCIGVQDATIHWYAQYDKADSTDFFERYYSKETEEQAVYLSGISKGRKTLDDVRFQLAVGLEGQSPAEPYWSVKDIRSSEGYPVTNDCIEEMIRTGSLVEIQLRPPVCLLNDKERPPLRIVSKIIDRTVMANQVDHAGKNKIFGKDDLFVHAAVLERYRSQQLLLAASETGEEGQAGLNDPEEDTRQSAVGDVITWGPESLCEAFKLGPFSFSAVAARVAYANTTLPADKQIKFHRRGQTPGLRQTEILYVSTKWESRSKKVQKK